MKKLLYGAAALAGLLFVSCNKEVVNPEAAAPAKNQVVLTVQASLDEATRTSYANEKTFSWVAGDAVRVRLYDSSKAEYSWETFTTEEGGATATFSATVDEGLELTGMAFYTFADLEDTDDYGDPNAYLPHEINLAELEDPLSVVPLLAVPGDDPSKLQFRTATGVLKISLVNVPDNVSSIAVAADENDALAGYFILGSEDTCLSQENVDSDYCTNQVDIVPVVENGSATVYVPVPVGTLSAGLAVKFYANGALLGKKETVKDVPVERNQLIVFPAIDVAEILSAPVEPFDVPVLWDFETEIEGWTFVDADGDGYNWQQRTAKTVSGSYALISESYNNDAQSALTPDNWAFTPPVLLTQGNYLSFWVRGQDASYANETYAVYIAKGSPEGETTVLVPESTFPNGEYVELASDGYYQHCVVQIPAEFDNEVVCIGFRHFNCTDMFWLDIDDVSITEENPYTPPTATYEDYLGEWAAGTKVYTISQKVAGESYSIEGIIGQEYPVEAVFENHHLVLYEQVVNTDGENELILQGSNGYVPSYPTTSKAIFSALYDEEQNAIAVTPTGDFVMFIWMNYASQTYVSYGAYGSLPEELVPYVPVEDPNTYIYLDDFENGFDAWTLFDVDGDGYNWYTGSFSGNDPHSGSYGFISRSWYSSALTPDNYAFTPAIQITANNYLSFWVTANQDYCEEHYAVYITTDAPTADNLGACAVLIEEREYPEGTPAESLSNGFQHFIVPIPATYEGQTVYIGFRHFNCSDCDYLMLDDVAVIEGEPVLLGAPAAAPAKAPKVQDNFAHRALPAGMRTLVVPSEGRRVR